MNKLQAAFGLTAAQGFGPNIFSGILASSKGQQENYLTASLRKKRKENAEERRRELERFPPYNVDYYGSKLLYAVNKGDVELVKLLLQRPDTNVSFEHAGNPFFQQTPQTALEVALTKLSFMDIEIRDSRSKLRRYGSSRRFAKQYETSIAHFQKLYDTYYEIIVLLMIAKSPLRPRTLALVWELSVDDLVHLFETFSRLKAKTIEFRDDIRQSLQRELDRVNQTIQDILDEEPEFVRNGENSGYYPVPVPDHLYIEQEILELALENLPLFVDSYKSKTGEYRMLGFDGEDVYEAYYANETQANEERLEDPFAT